MRFQAATDFLYSLINVLQPSADIIRNFFLAKLFQLAAAGGQFTHSAGGTGAGDFMGDIRSGRGVSLRNGIGQPYLLLPGQVEKKFHQIYCQILIAAGRVHQNVYIYADGIAHN